MCVWEESAVGLPLMASATVCSVVRIVNRAQHYYFSLRCIIPLPTDWSEEFLLFEFRYCNVQIPFVPSAFLKNLFTRPFPCDSTLLRVIQSVEQISSLLVIPPITASVDGRQVCRPRVSNVACDSLTAETVIARVPGFLPSALLFFTE